MMPVVASGVGREPCSVIVMYELSRQPAAPSRSAPLTSRPVAPNAIPEVMFSPKMSSDDAGTVTLPKYVEPSSGLRLISTDTPSARVTSSPAAGTVPLDHVVASCQEESPLWSCGHAVLAPLCARKRAQSKLISGSGTLLWPS
jgi:hypothetical protein